MVKELCELDPFDRLSQPNPADRLYGAMEQPESLSGRRVLIIEDDFLVAEALLNILEDAGVTALGPIGRMEEALAFIEDGGANLDGVVLDVNLHGQVSYPIADALAQRGIRFVFMTGSDPSALAAAYRGYPRCGKPFRAGTILAALAPPQS